MSSYARIKDTDNPAAYRYGGALPADSVLLSQLLKETEVQQLFESYYKLIKIPVAIIDLKANVLLSSRWQRICTQFHRVNPDTCALCVESDTDIAQKLTESKHYAIFPCANGLTDCASPIVIEGKHVANVFIGQFMTEPPDEARFRAQAQKYGFPAEDYLAAVREVPVVDKAKIPVILDLLERMTRVITTLSVDRKRAVENKALLNAIFEGTQDFIWTVDPVNFGIMTWNTSFGTYFSKSRGINDLAGKRPQDVFPDQAFVAWWKNAYASALRDGRYTAEYTTYKSGITMLLDLNLLKKEGRPFAISIFGKNITDRKQAEERYRALFESAQDGIALADAETGVLLDCNQALCRLAGRGREELIGQKQAVLHPPAESVERGPDTFKQHLRGNPGAALEDLLLQKGGKLVPVEIRASRLQLNGREVLLGLFRDITERKLAKEELEQKNQELELAAERLSVAVRAARIGVWDWDVPKNELAWDDGMYALYNLRREDFAGAYEAWASHVYPEDKARTEADIQAALRGEREYAPEFRIVWPGGEVRTIKAESRTTRGPDGKPLRMVGTNIDVTESRLAEQKLRDNELKYRALFETADDAILLFADGKWVDCNKAAGRVFGCEREQILGAHPKQFSPPTQPDGKDSMEEAPRLIGLAYEGKPQSFSWTHCRLDGTPFFAEVNLNRVDLGGKPHIQAIVRDVTPRKLAEEALRESNREMIQSQRDAGLGTYVLDLKTSIFKVSETMDEILGLAKNDPHTIEAWANLIHPEDRAGMLDYLQNEVIAKRRDADREYRIIRQGDKEVRWLYAKGKVEVDEHGVPAFFRGTSQDVTARKAAESRQALYLAVLKRLGDGDASDAVISDILDYVARSLDIEAVGIRIERDGDFPFLSARGYTPEFMEKERTLCGKTASGEPARDQDGNITLECLCGGVIRGTLGHDLPFMTKGGSLWLNSTSALTPEQVGAVAARLISFRGRCVDVGFESLALIPLRSKNMVIGLLHLADHRKDRLSLELVEFLEGLGSSIAVVMQRKEAEAAKAKLEEQVFQSQKMESVGRLAGGVAHDFNNLLTAITGYGSIIFNSLEEKDPRRGDMAEMLGAAQRGAALTQQLLAFSRKQVLNVVTLDLNTAVESTIKMLKRVIGEDIKVHTELAPTPCLIRTDAGQIGQVIMNLAVNARDAMPKGGTLRISTRSLTMPESFFAANPGLKPGPLIMLSVADNGCGMTEEIKQRIFEPFFTTKEQGKGTGLGLPTVYGIVSQSGGTVRLDTVPGKGTNFILYFPQYEAAHADAKEKTRGGACPEDFRGRGEKILLVEDDDSLRRLGERVLKGAGYNVLTVLDGKDALSVLEKLGGPVDMVITDVIMPGMTGRDLAKEIVKRGAARKILFVSGYTDEILSKEGEAEPVGEMLAKPFSPDLLLRKVCEMLHKPKG